MEKRRYSVLNIIDLPQDSGRIVQLGNDGGECAVFNSNGCYYAVGSMCPHQNALLDHAPSQNGIVTCLRHGYRFDLKTGDCLTIGGYGLPTYETKVEDDTLYVMVWEFD